MENIMEAAKAALKGDTVEQMSSWVGEDKGSAKRAIEASVPFSVAGIARYATVGGHSDEIYESMRTGAYPHVDADEVGRVLSDPPAADKLVSSSRGFMDRIFGGRFDSIVDVIAGQSGVTRASAAKLMGLSAPVVLGIIGKETQERHLDARRLTSYLGEQGRIASSALPAPLAGLIGGTTAAGAARTAEAARPREVTSRGESRRWVPWLIAAAIVAGLLAILFRRPARVENRNRPVPAEQAAPAAAPTETISADTGAGTLSRYLDGNQPTPHRFLLEGTEFDIGSAGFQSSKALDDVAAVLIAHPNARIRIEGHTDATGSAATNEHLSQARADAMKRYLVAHGVTADRIDAVGMGSSQPIASNDTADGRARNRRTELVVTQR